MAMCTGSIARPTGCTTTNALPANALTVPIRAQSVFAPIAPARPVTTTTVSAPTVPMPVTTAHAPIAPARRAPTLAEQAVSNRSARHPMDDGPNREARFQCASSERRTPMPRGAPAPRRSRRRPAATGRAGPRYERTAPVRDGPSGETSAPPRNSWGHAADSAAVAPAARCGCAGLRQSVLGPASDGGSLRAVLTPPPY
jgi:hypothetical protein